MLTPIEIVFSIAMTVASIFTALNFYLLLKQSTRETKMHTTDNLDKIADTVSNFWMASKEIKPYSAETEQWYMEIVEPYLSFLLWLFVKVDYKLLKISIIRKYNPQLKENYERIKPYIKYQRTYDQDAWTEIDTLNTLLGITA